MLSYCFKYKKNTGNKNPRILKITNGRTVLSSKCAICGNKKSRLIEEQ